MIERLGSEVDGCAAKSTKWRTRCWSYERASRRRDRDLQEWAAGWVEWVGGMGGMGGGMGGWSGPWFGSMGRPMQGGGLAPGSGEAIAGRSGADFVPTLRVGMLSATLGVVLGGA